MQSMGRPEVGKQQEQLPDEVNGLCGHFRVRIPCTQITVYYCRPHSLRPIITSKFGLTSSQHIFMGILKPSEHFVCQFWEQDVFIYATAAKRAS